MSDLLQEAKDAADAVFSDRSVDAATTRERLEELVSHVEISLQALREDERE